MAHTTELALVIFMKQHSQRFILQDVFKTMTNGRAVRMISPAVTFDLEYRECGQIFKQVLFPSPFGLLGKSMVDASFLEKIMIQNPESITIRIRNLICFIFGSLSDFARFGHEFI